MGTVKRVSGPWKAMVLIAIGLVGGGAAFAVASVPGTDGVIHACVQMAGTAPSTKAGNLRIIDPGATPAQTCSTVAQPGALPPEAALDWNATGLQGLAGTPGAPGAPGAAGKSVTVASGHTLTIAGGNVITIAGANFAPPNPAGPAIGTLTLGSGPGAVTVPIQAYDAPAPNIGSQSSGSGAGKVTFNPFSITRKIDKSSPILAKACAAGKHYTHAMLTIRKAGGTQKEDLEYKLTDALISSYGVSSGGDHPTESLSLNFTKIEFKNVPLNG
jgi:hypothetical protein